MFVTSLNIKNIRSIHELLWAVPKAKAPGWHVIIGDNGTGKSTLLRAIALSLVGFNEAMALRQDWHEWIRKGKPSGSVQTSIARDREFDPPQTQPSRRPKASYTVRIEFNQVLTSFESPPGLRSDRGWFSASFGPFRRFAGGDHELERLYFTNPKLARHLSVFGENAALTEGLEWLKQLQFAKLEKRPEGALLEAVTRFVNQAGFLPHQVRLHEVTSRGVIFRNADGSDVSVTELSDGYRSVLSLTFELIRQLAVAYGADRVFDPRFPDRVSVPGVVLIDEADAHLHPTWQRRIGTWFRTHFPKMQFIVTTHSPLICQAADVGTVFKLPTPGTDEKGRFIEGVELERLIFGNILDAYGTGAFGNGLTRSDESIKRLTRLAELNFRDLHGNLSRKEHHEQAQLQAIMPTAAGELPDPMGNGQDQSRNGANGKSAKRGRHK